MADTIQVTPQMLRSTANDIQANMEQAMGIAKGYLANQENVMNPATWSGAGVVASHMTATEITNELNKVLTGGTRLAEGLVQAAALMEGHEADSQTAFQALFGASHGSWPNSFHASERNFTCQIKSRITREPYPTSLPTWARAPASST